jgi:hypothetical protein
MKQLKLIFVFILVLISGCEKPTAIRIKVPPLHQQEEPLDNQMSFYFNGADYKISIMVSFNGYADNEIVIRGGDEGLENTLMLTFKKEEIGFPEIDSTMTGYWNLSLCTPMNKSLLTNETTNRIKIDSYYLITNEISGEFLLRFRDEKDPKKIITFSSCYFTATVDTSYHFTYCIEG